MDADSTPGWATGPDCFENEAQRRAFEDRRTMPIVELHEAYYYGELHLLALAIRDFRESSKILFAEQLTELEEDLLRLIHACDRRATYAGFPIPDAMKDGRQTH